VVGGPVGSSFDLAGSMVGPAEGRTVHTVVEAGRRSCAMVSQYSVIALRAPHIVGGDARNAKVERSAYLCGGY
jgi:hypothetical protein